MTATNSGASRPRLAVAVACALLFATIAVSVRPGSAVAAGGGRFTFGNIGRFLDTRDSGPPSTEQRLYPGAVYSLYIVPVGVAGTAVVHPCNQPAPTDHVNYTFSATGLDEGRIVVTGTDPVCVTASTPVHFVGDTVGQLSDVPVDGGLQYIASTPVVLLDQALGDQTDTPVVLPSGVPVSAAGIAALISSQTAQPGYVRLHPCGGAAIAADATHGVARETNLTYTSLAAGQQLCVYNYGAASVKITIVGYFSTDGPDPLSVPPSLIYSSEPTPPPGLAAITPTRVLDTRAGIGRAGTDKVPASSTVRLDLSRHVSLDTTAVALNVTATEPDGGGFVTVYPCDQPRPTVSNLNFVRDQNVPNLVNVRLSLDRTVCLYTMTRTHLVADLSATFQPDATSRAHPIDPARILDTRQPIGVPVAAKLGAGQTLTLQVAGRGEVPASGVDAVTMNVTVTEPDGPGFATVYPCDQPRPTASNLNYTAGQNVPNLVTVKLSSAGTVCLYTMAPTHLVADAGVWYGSSEAVGFVDVAPERILDTRNGLGVPAAGKVSAAGVVRLRVAGVGGVPISGAVAVSMNVTVTEPDAPGFVTVWPCSGQRPTASNLNHVKGQNVPNLVTAKLAADGSVCLYTMSSTHLVADIGGYFTADQTSELTPTASAAP